MSGLALDSRRVSAGTLFFALPGEKEDGGDFIAEAMARGAVCAVCEQPPETEIPYILVPDAHKALALCAEIILYLGAEKSTDKCIVPNVVGDSAATANQKIVNAGLIMGVSGATNASSSTVRAISQSIAAGTEVEAGTVVRVQFRSEERR